MQRLEVGYGFGCISNVRFRYDLQQRCAGSIEIDAGMVVEVFMQ